MDLQTLRTELREHLGVSSTDPKFPVDVLDLLLNRTFWEILDKFPFREKEKSTTFPSVIGERQYQIPGDVEALKMISVLNPIDTKHYKLSRMDATEYEERYVEDSNAQAIPTNYYREESTIYLFPTPDDEYTFTLKYNKTLADLESDTETPDVPRVWEEIILFGAVWRGYLRRGDHPRAMEYRNIMVNLVNSTESVESKEEADSQDARLYSVRPTYSV